MKIKKNTSDISQSNSGNNSLSFSAIDDGDEGNKLENVTSDSDSSKENEPAQVSEEAQGADATEKKDIQGEGFRGRKDARSSINQGSPASSSKEWAQENVGKGPKSHKVRYW